MSDTHPENHKTGALPDETMLGGRYRIINRLGQGGMGAVYLAFDERLDIECAIKEMSTALLKTEEERDRARKAFHEEAKLLARLKHPNLPGVSDHFSDHGKEYLVMELVRGETLAQILRRQPPPWSVEDMLAIAQPLTNVLEYLHNRQPPIIFRDLKPANVMRTPEGAIKLIDFGIARLFKPGQSHDTQAFGTVGYSSPEQYGQGQTDARSDVYALSVLLHQIVTGHDPVAHPFNAPAAHQLNPKVPVDMSTVLQTGMSQRPEDRFTTVIAFRRALLSSAEDVSRPPSGHFVAAPRMPSQAPSMAAPPISQPHQRPSGPYNQPTPNAPYPQQRPASGPYPQQPSGPYNQPTPNAPYPQQRPASGPYPQQPSGPYNQPTPNAPYPQQRPVSGPYHQAPPVLPPHQAPQMPVAAPNPYGPSAPIAESTSLAKIGRGGGILSLLLVIAGIGAAPFNDDVAMTFASFGMLLSFPTILIATIALARSVTHTTVRGRRHANIGLWLGIAALIMSCVVAGAAGS